MNIWQKIGLVALTSLASLTYAQVTPEVAALQQHWAEVNYLTSGKSQVEAFSTLIEDARQVTKQQQNNAEAWIWSGIIKSSYAGAKGGLGALSSAKGAKADFEMAMKLDANALNGSAYTSLGVLYLNVPGWPVGFGDDDKGVELLKKGLEISPDGIDSNYFYAQHLLNEKDYAGAESFLRKALQAPPRAGREIADKGRRDDIEKLQQQIEAAH